VAGQEHIGINGWFDESLLKEETTIMQMKCILESKLQGKVNAALTA
jgi:hypothetical protein